MINLLFCVTRLRNASPVKILKTTIEHLDKKAFRAFVVTLEREIVGDSILDELIGLGCQVFSVAGQSPLLKRRKLQDLIRSLKIHVIHTHCFYSTVLVSTLGGLAKKFTTIHQDSRVNYKDRRGYVVGTLMHLMLQVALVRFDVVAACSLAIARTLRNCNTVVTVRNGINQFDVSGDRSREEVRGCLGVGVDATLFLAVGSLDDNKNSLELAKNFILFRRKYDYLIYLGSGPLSKEIEGLGSKEILLAGKRKNVSEFLTASDYLISNSKSEGLPVSVIEALSLGKPVILSRIPSHREFFVLNDGIGYMFDSSRFSDVFRSIREADRALHRMNCLNLYNQHFSGEIMSKAYQELYLSRVVSGKE